MNKLSFFICVFVFVAISFATTPRSQAQLSGIPNLQFTPNFDQYAGYITLEGTTKNIFYWFFTSQDNPTNDPVILWLQGGPGCSDMGGGLFLENGPYYPSVTDFNTKTVDIIENVNSWNQHANVIYIDSPCGVGFSYGTNLPSDYETNDNITAVDSYMFLQGFFDIYSEFSQNEFWITGESYAGVYIPSLAYQVLTNGSDSQLESNLRRGGLMLGNPVTNCDSSDYTGPGGVLTLDTQVNLYYWHGMVSRNNYDDWNSKGCNTQNPDSLLACYNIYGKIQGGIGHLDQPLLSLERVKRRKEGRVQPTGSIDPDMLYFSYCTGNGTLDFAVDTVPDCFTLDDQVSAYLNDPTVQHTINAQPTDWNECSFKVIYRKLGIPATNYLEQFFQIAPEMRIMYYAGDIDIATVPFAETQRCLETMQRPIVEPWRPYVINKEVVGYVEQFDTYTFATIKGAGHEAPQFQPQAAYLLFSTFLNNGTLPGMNSF